MQWTDVPAGKVNAATQRFLVSLGAQADIVIDKIIKDEAFTVLLAGFARSPFVNFTSLNLKWQRARQIMGKNFFGVEEALIYFNIVPTHEDIELFAEIPFSEKILKDCRSTHFLVAVPPVAIVNLPARVSICNIPSAVETKKSQHAWKLIRKWVVPGTINQSWAHQLAMLDANEETLDARNLTYAMIAHILSLGEPLFHGYFVRCNDVGWGGHQAYLGRPSGAMYPDEIEIRESWGNDPNSQIGLAATRKAQTFLQT